LDVRPPRSAASRVAGLAGCALACALFAGGARSGPAAAGGDAGPGARALADAGAPDAGSPGAGSPDGGRTDGGTDDGRPVRVAFLGDFIVARRPGSLFRREGAAKVLAAARPALAGADLVVANLECPVGDEAGTRIAEKSVYMRGQPKALDLLSAAGVRVVSVANNHLLDEGPELLDGTLAGLAARGILAAGVMPDVSHPQAPVVVTLRGRRFAFLAYCAVCPRNFEPKRHREGLAPALVQLMTDDVRRARRVADEVVVLPHWGREFSPSDDEQRFAARRLAAAGARAVVGSHPHVLQEVAALGDTLVAYSLGNFLFDPNPGPSADGAVLLVDFAPGRAPAWSAVPLDLSDIAPTPVAPESEQGRRVLATLRSGYAPEQPFRPKSPPAPKATKAAPK
jgi:poly-gamma-glutamate synthesis protein (capsule biosynthesis protein)